MDAPPISSPGPSTNTTPPDPHEKKDFTAIIVSVSVVTSVILIIGIGIFLRARRKSSEDYENVEQIGNTESLQFDFCTISVATDDFSDANKLGQGGFGAVFKGILSSGQHVAVKRLSRNSTQGDLEFKNEVQLLARLQHRNLVTLLGFCLERIERLLVYEFVPNASLDHFIFNAINRELLDWERCYRIIGGIARGLQYLHEDSRLRIVHRDLKAGNILLDSEMNPKIADFGMARLFEMDQTQSHTNIPVGTFGYMAPEYVMHGRISVKSVVFSFGVLVLEIVSGQKRSSFGTEEEPEDLLTYAWKCWNEGAVINVIDQRFIRDSTSEDIMKCFHIGLLCVQESVSDRPSMASVIHMLKSDYLALPTPSKPGFFMQSSIRPLEHNSGSTHSDQLPLSQNEASITEPYPR